ncbi:MAG TPA: enoyl-CoA hydratase/isomerase family protein [Acidimicrobiales bacterium]|nr:enoyl-CoA hydratase/isomerase family protein [Acidimicrobiales bacterium]
MTVLGLEVERRGPVAWVILNDYQEGAEASLDDPDYLHPSPGMASTLLQLEADPAVRVVVVTGRNDGEFYRVCRRPHYDDRRNAGRLNPLNRPAGPGVRPSAMQVMALMGTPVIARMNGDAIGLGQAFLWGCDMIVAREDAVVADVHTGQGDVVDSAGEVRGFPWAVTPGDGAMSFAPRFLTPTKLKEYMFLSRTWTARQLADMHVINYAVPADQLDAVLDDIVAKLLARPAAVLAHTKRVCNKHLIEQWNLSQDLATAHELLDFWNHAANGEMG